MDVSQFPLLPTPMPGRQEGEIGSQKLGSRLETEALSWYPIVTSVDSSNLVLCASHRPPVQTMSTNTTEAAMDDEVLDFSDDVIVNEVEEVEAEEVVEAGEETPIAAKVSDDPNAGNTATGAVEGERGDTEEKEGEGQKEEQKEKVAAPYEYPTGIVTIDQL